MTPDVTNCFHVFIFVLLGSFGAGASYDIEVGLPLRNMHVVDALFWSVSDPLSTEYLKFRSIAELRDIVGASENDLAAAKDWLRSIGTANITVSALGDSVRGTIVSTNASKLHPRPFEAVYVLRKGEAAAFGTNERPRSSHTLGGGKRAAFGIGATLTRYTVEEQKAAYGMPVDLQATSNVTQMVWGPGTFGYSKTQLALHKRSQVPLLNMEKVVFDTDNHGTPGGDNFGEGNLDTKMIASFGLNVTTIVSNTNASESTEESDGFGAALLSFITELGARETVPHVLSMSLGSLSAYSCDLLCASQKSLR